ncbi:MAG: sugar phosphate isomerase/epimerase [Clostridiales bacterium]|nr:sugar phosphate isomerase/epimerase [Clostridiales bacterium]
MIKLGVNTVLYKPYTLREAVENLSKIGYDGFEISAIKGMCEHLDLDNWKDQKNEIKELCDEFGMEILASEVASSDPERLRLAFEAAKEIGIPVINIGPTGRSNAEGDLEACIETMKSLAELAESYEVTLCMKAHVGAAVYNTETTLKLIEAFKNPYFGIDMDPSHIFRAGEEPENALASVLPAMKHIHIRDCPHRLQNPGLPLQQTCGTGIINLEGYVGEMVKQGYSGPVDLEVIGPDLSLADCNIVAAQTYGYLNALLRSLGARGPRA